MSLWGNKDVVPTAGTITINLSTEVITGSGTSFTTAGYVVSPGDIINVGAGATYGRAVIASVTNNTVASVASTQFLIPDPATGLIPAGTAYSIDQKPKYTLEDGQYFAPDAKPNRYSIVRGVDTVEQQVVDASSGEARKYAAPHAGWVGIMTYIDSHGNLRVKTETLVAGSSISADGSDDTQYSDTLITISNQPQNAVGVATTTLTFSVTAAASPTASLSYQWQFSSTGVAYTNISNNSVYSGATTAGLGVTATNTALNGFYYRVVISATGANTVTSNAATLTVS